MAWKPPWPTPKDEAKETIAYSSSAFFVRRMSNALYELDMLAIAFQAEMEECYVIVEQYKNETNKTKFKKAQRAALRADNAAFGIKSINQRRKKILTEFAKVWGLYNQNDQESGLIVAEYLRTKGDDVHLREVYGSEKVERALMRWWRYVDMTVELSEARYTENRSKARSLIAQLWKKNTPPGDKQ